MSSERDPLADDEAVARVVEQLRTLEETLRDLAYERLREEVEAGATKPSPAQRRLEQAHRAVGRALRALAPDGEG